MWLSLPTLCHPHVQVSGQAIITILRDTRDVKLVVERLPRRMTPVFCVLEVGRHTDQKPIGLLHSPPDLFEGTAGTALSIYECSRDYLILVQFQACIQMINLYRIFRPTPDSATCCAESQVQVKAPLQLAARRRPASTNDQ